ncbi:hypothetical protein VPHD530_0032 [Vibrio phage D530]
MLVETESYYNQSPEVPIRVNTGKMHMYTYFGRVYLKSH